MADHAKFSPSKMDTILRCPGSVTMEEAMKQQDKMPPASSYAKHGTMLHEYTYESLSKGTQENLKDLEVEDKGAVLDCLNYYEILRKSIGHDNVTVRFEVKVSLAQWGLPEIWGTVDVSLKDNKTQHLHIIDWKFGSGVWVNAYKNKQSMTYAAGSLLQPTRTKKITVHIVQPFIDNYSTYSMEYDELHTWVHTELAIGMQKCKADPPEFFPGVEQCRWCAGKNHCEARFDWVRENAGKIFRYHDMTESIDKAEMIELIETGPEIEKAIKGYKVFVTEEIQRGRPYDGLKLVEGRAFRKWKDEQATLQWISENTEIDEMDLFKSKMVSPAAIEKLDKGLKQNEDFQALFDQPEGKPTLVKESDPRSALNPKKQAVDIFADFAVDKKVEIS